MSSGKGTAWEFPPDGCVIWPPSWYAVYMPTRHTMKSCRSVTRPTFTLSGTFGLNLLNLTVIVVLFFRTVWYELLCGEWPFKGQPPEAIIWQVGKGMKQPLANLQASRDVKVFIYTLCLITCFYVVIAIICS